MTYEAELVAWRETNPLRAARRALGLTTADAAAQLSVPRSTLSNWECGRNCPALDEMPGLARLAETEPGEFMRAWLAWMENNPA
jgi:DNA-binding transcriptional regulator YiaG